MGNTQDITVGNPLKQLEYQSGKKLLPAIQSNNKQEIEECVVFAKKEIKSKNCLLGFCLHQCLQGVRG
jgi:hypothetical protein